MSTKSVPIPSCSIAHVNHTYSLPVSLASVPVGDYGLAHVLNERKGSTHGKRSHQNNIETTKGQGVLKTAGLQKNFQSPYTSTSKSSNIFGSSKRVMFVKTFENHQLLLPLRTKAAGSPGWDPHAPVETQATFEDLETSVLAVCKRSEGKEKTSEGRLVVCFFW